MLSSKWPACDSKKMRFFKEQEVNALLSSLELKKPLSKSPLIGEVVKMLSLAGNKFMPETHLRQLGFAYKKI